MRKGDEITKRVGIWIRVSTEDQARGESPEHHEKRARYYAESKEWKVVETYHLEGVSGKAVMAHPEAQRMLKDIKSGHITGLIFSKLARLARSTKELLDFADIFRENDADLISLGESIDTSTPAGRLFYTMIAAMAQWEREEIAGRVAASVPIRAKLGKSLGGQAPFGYQWKDKRLVPDAKEAPVRARVFELFAEHRRKKAVARLLNEGGFRTRSGAKFSDTTIDRLLRDPLPKGQRRANYTKSLGDKKHWIPKPEEEWIFTEAEPIVSEELWNQCDDILNAQRTDGKKPGKRPVWLFAGKVVCVCNTKMYVPSGSKKFTCQKCRNKIAVSDLEEVFRQQLKSFLFSSEEISRFLENADQRITERRNLLESMEREREKLSREMKKVYQAYVADQLSVEAFGREYRPLEDRCNGLDEEIPRLQAEVDFLKIQLLSSDQVLTDARDLHTQWPELTLDEKHQIIENVTEGIIVGKDDISINLSYLPTGVKKNLEPTPKPLTPLLASANKMPQKGNATMGTRCLFAIRLCSAKPKPTGYPNVLSSLGHHIRKRRLDLGLLQAEVADQIGVDKTTICNWEVGRTEPFVQNIPAIVRFLGYTPYCPPTSFGEWLRQCRMSRGLSQEGLARALSMDESTVAAWEREEHEPIRRSQEKVKKFFEERLRSS